MNELVIKIKYDDDTSKDLVELIKLLREEHKPGWHTEIDGWRSGKKSLSERAVALMLYAIKTKQTDKKMISGATKEPTYSEQKQTQEINPFG